MTALSTDGGRSDVRLEPGIHELRAELEPALLPGSSCSTSEYTSGSFNAPTSTSWNASCSSTSACPTARARRTYARHGDTCAATRSGSSVKRSGHRSHSSVPARPSSSPIRGVNPTSSRRRATSATRRGGSPARSGKAPGRSRSGRPPELGEGVDTSRTRTGSPETMFTAPVVSSSASAAKAAAASSTCMKSRTWSPRVVGTGSAGKQRPSDRRHETALGFPWPVDEEDPSPRQLESRLLRVGRGHRMERVLGGPVQRGRSQRCALLVEVRPTACQSYSADVPATTARRPPASAKARRTASDASTQRTFSGAVQIATRLHVPREVHEHLGLDVGHVSAPPRRSARCHVTPSPAGASPSS